LTSTLVKVEPCPGASVAWNDEVVAVAPPGELSLI